ncbi:hypothetical protein BGX24_007071 [Mortierella sp. AD032]|nr:hypothetical protein BGX24_007071 [Mortierella sp. AD032]
MSSLRNRTHSDCQGWQDTRMHCLRVRRVVGRKHQMLRREHRTELATASPPDRTMYYHPKLNNDNSSWTTSSSESTHRATHIAGPGPISSHRRHNLSSERRQFPSQSSEPYSLYERSMSLSGVSAAPHAAAHCTRSYQPSDDAPLLLPLPPVVQRIDMAGSPFSPYSPFDPYATTEDSPHHRTIRSGNPFSGARTHSSGGGGSGGGGGTTTAPEDMSPGGGDATDGDTPSEYTFRRRNAIVEGSDDAPKADDFPNSSPK